MIDVVFTFISRIISQQKSSFWLKIRSIYEGSHLLGSFVHLQFNAVISSCKHLTIKLN